ncbi:MAG: cysteine desulfurase [Candidatus Marinimicrobia bacterium]|jgi:cysteine desulfurase/selenocysteine lyase|nr:cysteine desulfurase [Candidatus Neomarinimicrobiota bacterium]MBT6867035.1 cysteine desulfurase [Candidatus Neomarinimicrobiota bacterium]MBT7043011.1 cysteine desulfurase [Candidatus Neomarinimicrobiota bacterium]MBT7514927.1 cysteine desulfurase [Candidatus Neomarinimicrobiota bacterium]MBT7944982.1 cysteine desulfurase [Candidatus Neomarinimicrobiota bacterium]
MFSPSKIKKDFPIFTDSNLVYLDNAATSQKPQAVLDAVDSLYKEANANVHRALYSLGSEATERFENSRKKVANFINANSKEIIFTSGTTESINLLARSLGNTLKSGDEILISEMEHHSNIVPWQLAAKRTGATLRYLSIKKTGELDLSEPEKYFTKKTKIVSLTHMSNVLGTINPIKGLAKLAHNVGAIFIVDGAQGASHLPVNMKELDCDFYAFSGHKMLGPTGIGVLWGKTKLLEEMEPFMGGGEMINTVSMESSTWNDIPYKFEAGTPNFAQAVGLGAAIDYLENIGMEAIELHEKTLLNYALNKMNHMDGIRIHGSAKDRGGVISFNVDGIHPHDLAQFLNEDNIAIRVGHHCAQPLLKTLGESATARLSFYIYNDENDVDKFCDSLKTIMGYF